VNETLHTVLANPLPILRQIIDNQLYTARQVLDAAKAAGSALGQLGAGLPATLKAVGAKLSTGDVNGAIDALISSGLQPILNLLSNPWTALQPALERPFKVIQALIPALYDSGLSFLVGVVVSTVGIGFDTGTTPFLKQIVTSTQAVLDSLKTLNPVNIVNAVQHGIADVLQNAVARGGHRAGGGAAHRGCHGDLGRGRHRCGARRDHRQGCDHRRHRYAGPGRGGARRCHGNVGNPGDAG
jgi:hypothetical protein